MKETKFDSALEEIFYDDILVAYELLSMVRGFHTQFPLNRKRYDFALEVGEDAIILIECDGHNWHSSEEAIINDIYKNKLAENCKMYLLRFSGYDIMTNKEHIANSIEEMIDLLKGI